MTICACVNQNGGAGKTTTTLALAIAAGEARRVLAVDLDAQHVLTRQAGIVPAGSSIVDVFAGETKLRDAIVSAHGCDWLPAHPKLADVERGLASGDHGVGVLADVLSDVAADYDLILLDAPPNLGQLALNALGAADRVLVPVNAQNEASAEGLLGVVASMDAIGTPAQLDLIVTRYDGRRVAAGTIAATLDGLALPDGRELPRPLAFIPERAAVHRAGLARQPLVSFAPADPATAAYRELAESIV